MSSFDETEAIYVRELGIDDIAPVYHLGEGLFTSDLSGLVEPRIPVHLWRGVSNPYITVREAARLQSFPDWYNFLGTSTAQYRQVGNAVPPLLGLALGKSIQVALQNLQKKELVN